MNGVVTYVEPISSGNKTGWILGDDGTQYGFLTSEVRGHPTDESLVEKRVQFNNSGHADAVSVRVLD